MECHPTEWDVSYRVVCGNGMCRIVSNSNTRIGANLKKHDVSSRFNVSPYRIRRTRGSRCRIVQLWFQVIVCKNMPQKKSWTTINSASDVLSTRSKLYTSITCIHSIFQYVSLDEDLLVKTLDSTQLDQPHILQSRPRSVSDTIPKSQDSCVSVRINTSWDENPSCHPICAS